MPGDRLICTDLGHKSVAAESEKSKRVFFPEYEDLTVVSQSEEHLVLENQSIRIFKPAMCYILFHGISALP
ncbi:MAG: hypothetical protein WDM90_19855 [Ferruginibacter sp.]